jgi:uncharacterized protein (DUF488 family)
MQPNRLNLPSAKRRQQIDGIFLWNENRSPADADFFTFGYAGRKLADILDHLVAAHVRTVLDVRQNAVSMYRPEMSKANLRGHVEGRGLAYVHRPELGVPRDIRAKSLHTGTRDVIWEWYDEYVACRFAGFNLHDFFNSIEHPVAMMCAELDPRECHRHRLFLALENAGLIGCEL